MTGLVPRFVSILGSRVFFWGVLAFFCFQALWIAFSGIYPMAFDEEVHFGIIKIYAGQWSPFLTGQPAGADSFGALARDPSYLYHYIMSFPYRVVAAMTGDQAIQVIGLRLLNIPMIALSLVLFRKVLLRAQLSPALTHLSVALFTLIPIVPFLAGHINYDNALMVLVAWMLLVTYDIMKSFQARRVPVQTILLLIIICIFASLVKYAFLPIGATAVLFLVAVAWRAFRRNWPVFGHAVKASFRTIVPGRRVVLGFMIVLGLVLFTQRYGVNLVTYKTPVPSCDAVLSEQQCHSYGPWARNYYMSQTKGEFDKSPITYSKQWAYWLWHRMFFAVNGPASLYATRPPLPLPYLASGMMAIAGAAAVSIFWRRVFRGRAYLGFFLGVLVVYGGTLWVEDYTQYLETGWPVAVNGRYLLPIILLGAALAGYGFSIALRKLPAVKVVLAGTALVLFLQGGGTMTYILRSDETWNWSNVAVQRTNNAARSVLSPFIREGKKFYYD